jgi:hypothetical protein
MNKDDNVQRAAWLSEAITETLSGNDAFRRMLREYQDELTALTEKDGTTPVE